MTNIPTSSNSMCYRKSLVRFFGLQRKTVLNKKDVVRFDCVGVKKAIYKIMGTLTSSQGGFS